MAKGEVGKGEMGINHLYHYHLFRSWWPLIRNAQNGFSPEHCKMHCANEWTMHAMLEPDNMSRATIRCKGGIMLRGILSMGTCISLEYRYHVFKNRYYFSENCWYKVYEFSAPKSSRLINPGTPNGLYTSPGSSTG
jgi:hypothetical protein